MRNGNGHKWNREQERERKESKNKWIKTGLNENGKERRKIWSNSTMANSLFGQNPKGKDHFMCSNSIKLNDVCRL